jgi:hypothetical protein
VLLVLAALTAWSGAAVLYFYRQGCLLYYGDAESHLNIARRILDSRTPGYDQVGTSWLPMLHVLLIPFARVDQLWQNGLAAAFPAAGAFVAAGAFLFAAVRRVLQSSPAAWAAASLFALNPNVMYLQSTAMTEAVFFAALLALLYFTVRFRQTQGWGALVGAGLAALAGTLTRYDGWFLIPFAAAYVLVAAKRNRLWKAALFGAIALLGPLYWFGHNLWCCGDWLAFYSGPYSAKAIQGAAPYPGRGDWVKAWLYFRTAARLAAGAPLLWIAMLGGLAALGRRVFWPLLLLALPAVFYLCSMRSGITPIFVPELWGSYYNTRYGLALFPAAVFAAAALAAFVPPPRQRLTAILVVLGGCGTWLLFPGKEHWITWKEAQINSEARREWTRQTVDFLKARYVRGEGIITTSGDLTGIFRAMGLPLKEVLNNDNWPLWPAAIARPDLFLWEGWAVVTGGDRVQTALNWGFRDGAHYRLEKTIIVKGAPVVEIYRRGAPSRNLGEANANIAAGTHPGSAPHGDHGI